MLLPSVAVLVGLALLVWAADRFILGASGLARAAGISPLVVGMVIVGFGTSSPELAVSTLASLQGNSGIAIGNVVGSNICNIGLILGISALIKPVQVQSSILRKEMPVCLAIAVLLVLLVLDGDLDRYDGLVLMIGLLALITWMLRTARSGSATDPLLVEQQQELPPAVPMGMAIFWIVLGLALLIGASQLLIWGAVLIAKGFGVADLVICLTIVSVGTSLPELAASITGLLKGEDDIAIGNILGSNMFNVLAILIAPALISPGLLPDPMLLTRDLPFMVGFTALLIAMAAGAFGHRNRISRLDGGLLLAGYGGYSLILLSGSATT